MKQIFTSFSTVTEESSQDGDFAEHGWYDEGFRYDAMDKPRTGYSCEPKDEDDTAITLAIRFLRDKGVCEPSSSHFSPGIWYSTENQIEDYSSGEYVQFDFHLEGFSAEEQQEIFYSLFPRRH